MKKIPLMHENHNIMQEDTNLSLYLIMETQPFDPRKSSFYKISELCKYSHS